MLQNIEIGENWVWVAFFSMKSQIIPHILPHYIFFYFFSQTSQFPVIILIDVLFWNVFTSVYIILQYTKFPNFQCFIFKVFVIIFNCYLYHFLFPLFRLFFYFSYNNEHNYLKCLILKYTAPTFRTYLLK